jgi:hypothetical protein
MEAVAKHDFTATAEDELSFRRSQVLKVSFLPFLSSLLCEHNTRTYQNASEKERERDREQVGNWYARKNRIEEIPYTTDRRTGEFGELQVLSYSQGYLLKYVLLCIGSLLDRKP